jgi:hypothetical protein
MTTQEFIQYLQDIRYDSRLDDSEQTQIINELETHMEDKFQELIESGLTKEEAVRTCLGQMGSQKQVSRQIYEAYSQGSWKHVLLASMPHLIFGGIFALNWWQHIGWLSLILLLIIATTAYGWWHGKPTWVFSWLGYSLLPVIAVGLLLVYLPKGWSLLAIPIYIPMALWWLFHIIIQTSKRDWIFGSLMLLPIPIIVGWFLAISPEGKLMEINMQRLCNFAPWIGLSFLSLALTIAAFIRLRRRWIRIGLLATSGLMTITLIVYYTTGKLSMFTFLGLILVMWGVLLLPPLLEHRIRTGNMRFWVRQQDNGAEIKSS